MSGVLKKTTNLTGLPVCRHPSKVLSNLYGKILRALANLPQGTAYRQHTEKIVTDRLAIVKSESNIEKVEEKIGAGQVEELILQAEEELKLARRMLTWRPWEPLQVKPPPNQWKWPI